MLHRLFRSIIASALVVILLLPLASCQQAEPAGESIRISVNPTAFFLPLLVAHDRGFFKAHGLNSEIIMLNSTSEATNAFLSGHADVSALGSGGLFFLDEQSRGKVKLVYLQFNRSYALLVPKDSPIRTLEDLKGKKIGMWPSPTPQIFLRLLLEPRIGTDQFVGVPLESRFLHQALITNEVDAIFAADVHAAQSIRTGLTRFLSQFPMEEYVQKPFFHGGGLLRAEFIDKRPQAAKRIQAALADAVRYIKDHESEARDSITRHVGVDADIAKTTAIDGFAEVDDTDLQLGQQLADRLTSLGILKEHTNVERFKP